MENVCHNCGTVYAVVEPWPIVFADEFCSQRCQDETLWRESGVEYHPGKTGEFGLEESMADLHALLERPAADAD